MHHTYNLQNMHTMGLITSLSNSFHCIMGLYCIPMQVQTHLAHRLVASIYSHAHTLLYGQRESLWTLACLHARERYNSGNLNTCRSPCYAGI